MIFDRFLTLENGKRLWAKTCDLLIFYRTIFIVGEEIEIPADKTLILASPTIDSCLIVDGEAYII